MFVWKILIADLFALTNFGQTFIQTFVQSNVDMWPSLL